MLDHIAPVADGMSNGVAHNIFSAAVPTAVTVHIELSPCRQPMNASVSEVFDAMLLEFLMETFQEQDPSLRPMSAATQNCTVVDQSSVWHKVSRVYRKLFTKRRAGDPVGEYRLEVEQLVRFRPPSADHDEASRAIDFAFLTRSSALVERILSNSSDIQGFFVHPDELKVISTRQSRFVGLKAVPVMATALLVVVGLFLYHKFHDARMTRDRRSGRVRVAEYRQHAQVLKHDLV